MEERIPRVNSLIKDKLSEIILKEVEFPEGILVTLTRVQALPNLSEADVFISVMPSEKADNILKILRKLIYGLQKKLNKSLNMRPIPKIRFLKESKIEEAARIEEILGKLKN